jgi:hypothetical protein
MNKYLFLFLFVSLNIVQSFCEPRMIDVKRYMLAAGEEDGIFQGTQDIAKDDLETFFALAFFSDNSWSSTIKGGEKIKNEELPLNKEGGLRLFAFFKFRIVEKPSRENENLKSIQIVKQRFRNKYDSFYWYKEYLKTNPPITWTDEEIADYYSKAIRNKIEGMELRALDAAEAKQFRELLIAYCVKPTTGSGQAFTKFAKSLSGSKPDRAKAIATFMNELSPELGKTLGL